MKRTIFSPRTGARSPRAVGICYSLKGDEKQVVDTNKTLCDRFMMEESLPFCYKDNRERGSRFRSTGA